MKLQKNILINNEKKQQLQQHNYWMYTLMKVWKKKKGTLMNI